MFISFNAFSVFSIWILPWLICIVCWSQSENGFNLRFNRHFLHSSWRREQLSRISLAWKIILMTVFPLLMNVKVISRRAKLYHLRNIPSSTCRSYVIINSCIFELFIIMGVVLMDARINRSVFEREGMPTVVCRICSLRYVVVTHSIQIHQIDLLLISLQMFSCAAFMIALNRSTCPGF